jgi:hypothetical protein
MGMANILPIFENSEIGPGFVLVAISLGLWFVGVMFQRSKTADYASTKSHFENIVSKRDRPSK